MGKSTNTLGVPPEEAKPNQLAAHWVRKTLGDPLSDVEAHSVASTMAATLPEAKA